MDADGFSIVDNRQSFCAPEEQGPVVAPPAVSTVVIRPSTATTSAGLKLLSPIRPPASATSVGISPMHRTPPVVAVLEDFMLFNAAMTNQIQPESGPSLMGDVAGGLLPVFPQVGAPGPEVGLDASGERRRWRIALERGRSIFIKIVRVLRLLHSCCKTLRDIYSE